MHTSLYHARILDHAQHPRNSREMPDATMVIPAVNASCGDTLTLYVRARDASIQEVSFIGTGCAISQAASSLLAERLQGMTIAQALAFSEDDMRALLGIEISIGRRKCALLAWQALRDALLSYKGK